MEPSGVICRTVETASSNALQTPHLVREGSLPHTGPVRSPLASARRRNLLLGIGGTVLSVVGFLAMILFEQYNGLVSELRNDLKHFNETSSEYVKRESFQKCREQIRECLKELQASSLARVQLEQELRTSEKAREELARELQRLRERLAYVEGWQTARPKSGSVPTVAK